RAAGATGVGEAVSRARAPPGGAGGGGAGVAVPGGEGGTSRGSCPSRLREEGLSFAVIKCRISPPQEPRQKLTG
ncbi:MAG: hypothetical protein ABF680_15080, partial [Acetobacter persici]